MLRSPVHAGLVMLTLLSVGVSSCGQRSARVRTPTAPALAGTTETGTASWYGAPYHGRRTASGEVYDMEQRTAAHRQLAFETWVEVTNLENGRKVEVRINDRGPFAKGRIIDLSRAAARDIAMLGPGTAKVRVKVIARPTAPVALTAARGNSAQSDGLVSAESLQATFAVQAGGFADRARAEALQERLAARFAEVRVVPTERGPRLWRVLVGGAMPLDQANALASQVQSEAGAAMVIADPGTGR